MLGMDLTSVEKDGKLFVFSLPLDHRRFPPASSTSKALTLRKASKQATKAGSVPDGEHRCVLRLFVAHHELQSDLARKNLARIYEDHLKERYTIEIIDVTKNPEVALEKNCGF